MTTSDVGDQPTSAPTRRALLGAALAGVAAAAAASRAVSASGPSATDRELCRFAMQLELTARDLYRAAVDSGVDAPLLGPMAEQHESYAQALAGFAGLSANTRNDEVFDAVASSFTSGTASATLEAAYELESVASATHTELLALVEGPATASLMASILIMEARHCAVLADAAGRGADLDALLVNTAAPLLPEDLA